MKKETIPLAGDYIVRVTGRASPYNINRLTLYTKQGDSDADDNDGFEYYDHDDDHDDEDGALQCNINRISLKTKQYD